METAMPVRRRKIHPALKHAGYSAATLLPGEDQAAFEKLHRDLAAEFQPVGTLEENIIASMARYVWRKNNLNTFRVAEFARDHRNGLYDRHRRSLYETDPAEEEYKAAELSALDEADRQARKELREAYELVDAGDIATIDDLQKILAVEEYLDSLIDKCIKRLLHVRGVKSISLAPSSSAQECIAAARKNESVTATISER
jgi:hypothetical protein